MIIEPVGNLPTHLVVKPGHGRGIAHLVPVGLAALFPEAIELHCTKADVDMLTPAQERRILPATTEQRASN